MASGYNEMTIDKSYLRSCIKNVRLILHFINLLPKLPYIKIINIVDLQSWYVFFIITYNDHKLVISYALRATMHA
jgi:hypothetical protein